MFKKPEQKTITQLESEVLEFWQKNKIFEKSVESRLGDNLYVFYDGPPFISGLPHYGHLLGSIAKDLIPRYWTMKGKRVERVWGWDAHGLTVENKVQKELGIENRRDIEKYGLDKFTQACHEYTSRVSSEWKWYIDRIGRWVDMDNSYKTTDQSYMESVMWAFKELYEKGFIYEGVRTSLFCTTCGTPVSNFEIAMDNSYKDVEDPAVTVKFPVTSDGKFKGVNLLAWTTTPWTLPSNRALVVDPSADYVLVSNNSDEKFVLAEARLESVFSGIEHKVIEKLKGSELLRLEYEPPYKFFDYSEKEFKVYEFEGMVNMEDGTGIVHSAPGFGEVDTEMGRHYGLRVMLTVDDAGHFIKGENTENPFAEMFYKKADKYIMQDLEERALMFKNERIIHRFPYHDRCDTLLIQRAQNSWFLKVSELKPKLLDNNEEINWVPDHLKHGRFAKGIEQAPDWCISRNRFWATPMPVWESKDGDRIVIASIKELEELSGQKVKDLHRPYIDDVVIKKDGKEYHRRPEVLDSWFEAGSMPYAQIHYPYENEDKFEKNFPGDYIVEYVGQVRAWFYVMHVLSTALFGKPAFKNVISTGIMAGSDGRKMSKTYGNYTDPKEIMEGIGGDALRLYLMDSPLMVGDNANFDDNELRNKSRNVLNPLWNSAMFFLIYAEMHKWEPKDDKSPNSKNILDKWILIRLDQTIKETSENIEAYLVPNAVRSIESFIEDLSNWYVRRSRDRISNGDPEALGVLHFLLNTFSKVCAPITPFMAESIYRELKNDSDLDSVHLCEYPIQFELENNLNLLSAMDEVRKLASLGNALRKQIQIPVRQPLSRMFVIGSNSLNDNAELVEILKDELNVKEVDFVAKMEENIQQNTEGQLTIGFDTQITRELEIEGAARELIREIQKLRKDTNVAWDAKVNVQYDDNELYNEAVEKFAEDIKAKTLVNNLVKGDGFKLLD